MALYQNINGVWTLCQKPYVKRGGVWQVAEEAWVKRSGTWVNAYDADVTPPNPPEITLQVSEDFDTIKGQKTLKTRFIKVGVRIPGTANDPDARLTRVLSTYNGKPPTTQFGGTYTSASDDSYPNEPWSEWRYNDYGGHDDTSLVISKQWPRNAVPGTIIKGDETYYFTGWSLDNSGNWSAATPASIHIPKNSVDMPNVITKEARFQANSGGSWRTAGFQSGDLIQQKSPRSQGLFFYGNQITDAIGEKGPAAIKSAQIYIKRTNDTGSATCNMYLFWTAYGNASTLPNPVTNDLDRNEVVKIGQLAKNQGAWFDLPESFYDNMSSDIKGMGLAWKDPIKADAAPNDFSEVVAVGTNLRCGEIHVVWEETMQ